MGIGQRLGLGAGIALLVIVGALGSAWVRNPQVEPVPATVADDPSLPSVTIDGVTFHAESHGAPDAPTIIVVHGGPGGDYRNLLVLKELAQDGFRVVFYDQRGSGLSPRVPAEQLTFDSSLEDLHRMVQHYGGGDPVTLIGHSWGGMLAAYYVAAHPELVARVVMAEPGVLTTEELRDFAQRLRPSGSLQTLWYIAGVWFEQLHVNDPDPYAGDDYFLHRMMSAPGSDNPLNAYWCNDTPPPAASDMWRVGSTAMQAISRSSQQDDGQLVMPPLETGDVQQEVLFVASECNTLIGVERQTSHVALFPNARLEVIEGAGHLMFTDQPEASFDAIREYLAGWPAPPEPAPEAALPPQ